MTHTQKYSEYKSFNAVTNTPGWSISLLMYELMESLPTHGGNTVDLEDTKEEKTTSPFTPTNPLPPKTWL